MTELKKSLLKKEKYNIDDLRSIMKILRSNDGCPWDREQNHTSIRQSLIEEAYEVIEAIDNNSTEMMREELGDLLLQVVFHSQISEEDKEFDFDDVADEICKKLIVRHPHVFSDVEADTSEKVLVNWEAIKKETKGQKTLADTLNGIAVSLPSLMRASKIYSKALKAGIETADSEEILHYKDMKREEAESEIAQKLFTLAAACKEIGVEPEQLLYDYNSEIVKKLT